MGSLSATRTVTPYLFYEDVEAAVEWLACAFGFREVVRYEDVEGAAVFAELTFGAERLMIAQAVDGRRSPGSARPINALVYITVDDVDAHFLRSKEALACVVGPPRDTCFGLREYSVEDPEGHRWVFAQQVRDVLPGEWRGRQEHPVRTLLSAPFAV